MKQIAAFLCLMLFSAFEAHAQNYCVQDLNIIAPDIKIEPEEHVADYDYSKGYPVVPKGWLKDAAGKFIAAARNIVIEDKNKKQRQQTYFWFFKENSLSQPVISKDAMTGGLAYEQTKDSTNATDGSGNVFYIGGHYSKDNSQWVTALYELNPPSAPKQIEMNALIPAPRSIFWSDN